MPLFVTVSRGTRADRATAILASSDPIVVDAVLSAVAHLHESDPDQHDDNRAKCPQWRLIGGDRESNVRALDERTEPL